MALSLLECDEDFRYWPIIVDLCALRFRHITCHDCVLTRLVKQYFIEVITLHKMMSNCHNKSREKPRFCSVCRRGWCRTAGYDSHHGAISSRSCFLRAFLPRVFLVLLCELFCYLFAPCCHLFPASLTFFWFLGAIWMAKPRFPWISLAKRPIFGLHLCKIRSHNIWQ